jgi:hypothetical protein
MDKQIKRMLLLFSLILVIIPMVIFPGRMGMPLINSSAVVIYEMVYYAVVLYFMRRQSTLAAVLVGSALTLVYRLALGAATGMAIIVMYGIDGSIAFSLGMTKYLPALLLHAAAAPFVMRPVYLAVAERLGPSEKVEAEDSRVPRRDHQPVKTATVLDQDSIGPFPPRTEDKSRPAAVPRARLDIRGTAVPRTDDDNQFERAVAYIGESGTVKLALLVDEEGLTLARFSRCTEDPDLWAPLAVILDGQNRNLLHRYRGSGVPEKIDVSTGTERIILRRIDHVTLIVLSEHNADETIHIRIAQAADMVRKYMSERYSPALFARVEEHYVSHS